MCPNPKCKCQNEEEFTPNQFQLEEAGFKNTMKKKFKRTEKLWNNFSRPGLKLTSANISARAAAKTKNPQAGEVTSKMLKSLTGGKSLSLTDMHGQGLRIKVT